MSAVVSLKPGAAAPAPPSRFQRFRNLLNAPELSFLMEAHNGLSAKIVEEAGFEGIWASGLTISAALGVRDRNEASWTQVLEVLEFMADAATLPIMLDGDTGYGDFNNFRRLVRKLCQRDVAAVCIEDKVFPKTNSFIESDQALADVDEFCGKIKAGKDSQLDDDFSIVARVEALIAGWGLDEALRRAEAYHAAGADGVLIHSRKATADEVLRFCAEWDNRAPVVIVPTKYYATPTERFREAGVSVAIWANHNLRASINAMRETARRIHDDQSLTGVEDRVATVSEVFALADEPEMAEAERRYLPGGAGAPKAVLLAATRGGKLGPLTADRPKCMLDVRGEPLLRRFIRALNGRGIRNVTVVAGYRPEAIDIPGVDKVVNDAFEDTGEVASLARAVDQLDGPALVSYGDILVRDYILDLALEAEGDIVAVVDGTRHDAAEQDPARGRDLVVASKPYTGNHLDDEGAEMVRCSDAIAGDRAHGEWIGLVKLSQRGAARVRDEIEAMRTDGSLATAGMPDLFNRLVDNGHAPRVVYVAGDWLDVNDAFDLAKARNFL